ncbi:MAG: non-ribosomal peptide synthetase [Candidatus Binatia bacterium]
MAREDFLETAGLSDEKHELLTYLLGEEGIEAPQSQTIFPREETGEAPLSFSQERLWFLNQLDPESASYNEPTAVQLLGPLDAALLEHCVNEVVRRHEILRAAFRAVEGAPAQVIRETVTLNIPVVDLRNCTGNERDAEIHTLALDEFRKPFDLSQAPLVRFRLLQTAEEEHVLLIAAHHIISDGWSVGVLFHELAALYHAFANDREPAVAELSIQYADFAHWQRRTLQDDVLRPHLAYWKQKLAGSLPLLELPLDRPRPAVQTSRGARHYFSLPKPLSESIKSLSQGEGVTLFMTLLAAFQALLQRYTGQEDIIVGSPVAGRNWPEVENLIGCFLNTIVLRTQITGSPSFRELLGRVRQVATEAYAHQDLPFEQLVDELHPERDMSRNPLFQVMFVLQNPLKLEFPGLSVRRLKLDRGATPFDLILSMEDAEGGLGGWFEYNTDLFDAGTIARAAGHLQALLKGVVENPEQQISDLPLLTDPERRQLTEWNSTQAHYPQDLCLHQLFEAQVERTPDSVAVIFEDERLTYQELNHRANQLAHHLRKLGVEPDVLVGICMERSLEMVVGLLGILKAGAAYVPLDPEYPRERLAFMLEDSRAPVLLTQTRLMANLPGCGAQVVCVDPGWQAIANKSDANPAGTASAENIAYVIYTSGSTGQPKGVMIPHSAICNHMFWMQDQFPLSGEDRVVQKTPFSFDASVWEFFAPLISGVPLVIARPGGHRDAAYLASLIAQEKITVLQLVPSLLQLILEEEEVGKCRCLRRLFCGGEALSIELQERVSNRLGGDLHNLYGPTEATIDATFWTCGRDANRRNVPIGRPVSNTEIYLLDANWNPVPVGITGEIYLGGKGLARGYWNRPGLTAEKFLPNPFSTEPGSRLYRTGDLARYGADGAVEFLGRIDHQVKMRGFRIELGEIESVLSQHPAVVKSLILIREEAPGDQRLVAYVVAGGQQADESELRSFVKRHLPEYMAPSAFVTIEAFPLTPNGKIDRRALPAPGSERTDLERTYVAPRDVLEIQLATIWEKILGIEPIGIKDNFFDTGGHSLLAVRLLAQIEKLSGKKLPLVTLFQAPTVEQLAKILRQEEWNAPWSSLVPIQPLGSKPPFFCVHAAAGNVLFYRDLARHLGADQPFYGLQAQGLDGDQDPYTRVEEMAGHYIDEIRTVQPEGPYLLGGLSFGGILAYEMAQQLRAQGQKVGLLVLFDTYGPDYPNMSLVRLACDKAKRQTQRIYKNLRRLMRLDPRAQAAFALQKAEIVKRRTRIRAKKRVLRTKERILTVVCRFYVRMGLPLPPSLRYLRVRDADHEAHSEYRPKPYLGPVTLFRASRQPLGCHPDPKLGWGGLVNGQMEIHEIPGSHSHTLIREPQVRIVVEKLKPCLNKAQSTEVN